jgi:hypothetical protein
VVGIDPSLAKSFAESLTRCVTADETDRSDLRAERGDVEHRVAGSTGAHLFVLVFEYERWGLPGDSGRGPVKESVSDNVSPHQNTKRFEPFDPPAEIGQGR